MVTSICRSTSPLILLTAVPSSAAALRGVEIEDAQEILMLEAVVRFKPAAGHERIGDADGGGALEGRSYVEFIIPVKKGIVNDGEDIPLIVPPVFICKLRRDALKLVRKPSFPSTP